MNKSLADDIKTLLVPKYEREKKQVALFLNPKKIEELDELVKELAKYSNGKVNRNILIEKAVDNLIDTIPDVIREYEKIEDDFDKIGFDLLVCPSHVSGIDFIEKEHKWQYIKVDANKIPFIKYIALYVGSPCSAIIKYAEVDHFEEVIMKDKQRKYIVHLKGPIHDLNNPVELGKTSSTFARGIKYTTLEKLLNAKEYSDIL